MFLSIYEIACFVVLLIAVMIAERAAARSADPARWRGATMIACTLVFGIVAGYIIGTQTAWVVAKRAARDYVSAEEVAWRIQSVFLSPWTLALAGSLYILVRSRTNRDRSQRISGDRR
ncbi:hypothetical protein [Tahibacter sp.]|uniref:hypothetical protein n=1 Tax=Tahibacter sp. TaxID=2056211 RepID=UPI0028C4EE65|nr:hypothetical protein [Tahibacter sp.]